MEVRNKKHCRAEHHTASQRIAIHRSARHGSKVALPESNRLRPMGDETSHYSARHITTRQYTAGHRKAQQQQSALRESNPQNHQAERHRIATHITTLQSSTWQYRAMHGKETRLPGVEPGLAPQRPVWMTSHYIATHRSTRYCMAKQHNAM